jgi:hypothetical protein
MTAKQLFEYTLIELNKVQAPSLILEDYNYFINKAINQYINRMYNFYDINQQKTDDLRVLKSTAVLTPTLNTDYDGLALLSKTYKAELPDDYLHILNCVLEYSVAQDYKCYDAGNKIHFGAKRLTADMFSQIINNYYMRPTYKNPYYYINNKAEDIVFPIPATNSPVPIVDAGSTVIDTITFTFGITPGTTTITIIIDGAINTLTYSETVGSDTTFNNNTSLQMALSLLGITSTVTNTKDLLISDANLQKITDISITGSYVTLGVVNITNAISLVQRTENYRYGNRTRVRLELRYGKDDSLFVLSNVYVDYLKAPLFIRLTQEQVDEVEDNSQLLEFPDYVNQEIVNELIKLLMENASDQRLPTNIPINQSIANPAQEQQQQKR